MEQVKFFEDAIKQIEAIEQMPKCKAKEQAEDEFYNSLPGWKSTLFNKYYDARNRKNHFIDFDDCPSEKEIASLVACLRECEAQHITVSSGWSSLVERMWAFCQAGCKLEGMVKINCKSKDWETGEYDTQPAFLLSVEEVKE